MPPLLFPLLLFFLGAAHSVDPIEQIIRNTLMSMRGVGEQVLSRVVIPNSADLQSGQLMFSVDPQTASAVQSLGEFFNLCPSSLPPRDLLGSWQLAFASKRLVQTVFGDVDEAIDRLSSQIPLSDRVSIGALFRDELAMRCANFTFAESSLVEFSYSLGDRSKSIVGQYTLNPDRSISLQLAPNVDVRVALTYSNQLSPLGSAEDVMVLSQTDSFPKCDNVIVLARTRRDLSMLVDQLTQSGSNFPGNPLRAFDCPLPVGGSVIRPLETTEKPGERTVHLPSINPGKATVEVDTPGPEKEQEHTSPPLPPTPPTQRQGQKEQIGEEQTQTNEPRGFSDQMQQP